MRVLHQPDGEAVEILDREGLDPATVERALAELRRVNRLLLGHLPARRTLLPRLAAGPARQRLLDVGTGSGEVAAGLAARAAASGRRVRVVGVDRKLAHLLAGRRLGGDGLRVVADARRLPFRDGAVDWSLSTLFFHHFEAAANRRILAEMRRVALRGAAVVDLRRSRLAALAGALLIPLTGAGPVTRHDGRASLARAWTLAAVRRLVSDLPGVELRRRFPFRFALVLAADGAAVSGAAGDRAPTAAARSRPPRARR